MAERTMTDLLRTASVLLLLFLFPSSVITGEPCWSFGEHSLTCPQVADRVDLMTLPQSTKWLRLYFREDTALTTLTAGILTDLPQITYLEVNLCNLLDIIPGTFGNLSSLVHLNLFQYPIEKGPGANAYHILRNKTFQGLVNLRILDLGTAGIGVIETRAFHSLSNLKVLKINKNNFVRMAEGIFFPCPGIHTLDLSDNNLQNLTQQSFQVLSNLKWLYLENCNISSIQPGTFRDLHQVSELSLGRNTLHRLKAGTFTGLTNIKMLRLWSTSTAYIETGAFRGLRQLHRLYIEGSELSVLQAGMFRNLGQLRYLSIRNNPLLHTLQSNFTAGLPLLLQLDLSKNSISQIQVGAFKSSPLLKSLSLQGNHLTHINEGAFQGLMSGNHHTTYQLDLSFNRWRCTCRLRWLLDWATEKKEEINLELSSPLQTTCQPYQAETENHQLDIVTENHQPMMFLQKQFRMCETNSTGLVNVTTDATAKVTFKVYTPGAERGEKQSTLIYDNQFITIFASLLAAGGIIAIIACFIKCIHKKHTCNGHLNVHQSHSLDKLFRVGASTHEQPGTDNPISHMVIYANDTNDNPKELHTELDNRATPSGMMENYNITSDSIYEVLPEQNMATYNLSGTSPKRSKLRGGQEEPLYSQPYSGMGSLNQTNEPKNPNPYDAKWNNHPTTYRDKQEPWHYLSYHEEGPLHYIKGEHRYPKLSVIEEEPHHFSPYDMTIREETKYRPPLEAEEKFKLPTSYSVEENPQSTTIYDDCKTLCSYSTKRGRVPVAKQAGADRTAESQAHSLFKKRRGYRDSSYLAAHWPGEHTYENVQSGADYDTDWESVVGEEKMVFENEEEASLFSDNHYENNKIVGREDDYESKEDNCQSWDEIIFENDGES